MEHLTLFELQRQQLIARNRARLLALGIPEAVAGLAKLQPVQAQQRAKPKAPRKRKDPEQPTRQSGRLRDQALIARGEVPPDVEQGSELALFIIDGECPRCGKVLSSGHARHLQSCKGPPEPPTEEEIEKKAAAYKSQQKDKLRQLELGGLVEYNPGTTAAAAAAAGEGFEAPEPSTQKHKAAAAAAEDQVQPDQQQQQPTGKGKRKKQTTRKSAPAAAAAAAAGTADSGQPYATFIVIGSTGNHYVVRLCDERRTCTCLDHRIRRRDCKHIRLIWEQLGIADTPEDWQQALDCQVSELAAADAADVDKVKQADERKQALQEKAAAKAAAKSRS